MKGVLFILILLALLFGGYLVYRNLSEQTSLRDDTTHIRAVDKARKAAETIEEVQGNVQRRARRAAD